MKAFRFLSTVFFCALLTSAIVVCAQEPQQQEERRDQAKPPEQQEPRREARPTSPQDEKPPKQEEAKPPKNQQREEQAKPPREQKSTERAWQQPHPRPTGKSARIPEDKFRASFGRQHTFVINQPMIVQGQPQFVVSGFTFILLDPWPADWLFTDECFIDDIDGDLFLFDVFHPGIRVALFVVG